MADDDSMQPTIFGGPEAAAVKVEVSDDALGLGRAVEGVAREIRKGPEGLLDRADRFYELKHTLLPVHSAKRDAKALTVRAEALRSAAEILGATSPENLTAAKMMIADYTRRYQNLNETIARAVPMIADDADPEEIDDDWLGFAFDYIGGVSDRLVQELWARLLAQEAGHPGLVSKRAVSKLALMDRRSTYQLRKILDGAISLYVQTPEPRGGNGGMPLYKIGRFAFPLLIEMLEWSGPKPDDDLRRGLAHGHDSPSMTTRNKTRWLLEEGFLRTVEHEQMREGYLDPNNWAIQWEGTKCPLGIRVGLGPIYGCEAQDFVELIRRYSNDGATAQIVQLTGLAEALLDPRIRQMDPIADFTDDQEPVHTAKDVEEVLVAELRLQPAPRHHGIAENPGYLDRDGADDRYDLEFYYHEY